MIPSTKPQRRTALVCAALFLGTLLLFSRSIGNDFVNYDDPVYVTSNPYVQAGFSGTAVRWAFTTGHGANWHPITWLSHMADWALFGDDAQGHHAVSLFWHALNAVLVFLVFRRLTGTFWTAAFCAALFAWHPLRVESVAWIAERKDLLSGFFFLLTLWFYALYVEERRARFVRTSQYLGFTLLAFAIGLMCKPMLVSLPGVLLLLDFWPLRRLQLKDNPERISHLFVEKLPFVVLSIASCAITLFMQKEGGAVSAALPITARLANAAVSFVGYLQKFFVPVDLTVLYPHPGFWPVSTTAGAILFLSVVTGVAVFQLRARPWLASGWLWFLIMLLPVSGLVQVGLHYMADRYTYLPILGVQMALVWTISEAFVSPRARRICAIAAAAILAACAVLTWRQLGVWETSLTLFDQAIAVTKNNYLAYNNRGLYHARASMSGEAMADYRKSLSINPRYPEANNNLGEALARQGRPRDGLSFYHAALEAKPDLLEAHQNLGNALADGGKPEEALPHYEWVLARQPWNAGVLSNSGIALAMLGNFPEAIARLEAALRLEPDNAGVQQNLTKTRAMMRDATSRGP
ncbi:MAG: tetratricopeptide repeat protein [Chthoniobacterales bacterium]|nr:tetratricopeptide repeat protein [Chthoniobacterales bacterium]